MYDIHGIMWQPSDVQHLNLALIPPRSLAKRRRMHNAPLTLYATQEQNDEGGTFEVLSHEADLCGGGGRYIRCYGIRKKLWLKIAEYVVHHHHEEYQDCDGASEVDGSVEDLHMAFCLGVLPIPKTAKLTRSSSSTGTINTSTSSPRREYAHAPESSFLPKRSSSLNNTSNPILPLQPLVSSSTSNTSELDKMKNELNQFMASRYALCLWAINRINLPFAAHVGSSLP
ncbi:hypothetical protein PCASD_01442 [Puccinia coronata f. sp. avenae]|uniref:Uncharacterized protein n=1 Tax=Puccinia coronata f. sp. avenae TaxID=200324 RepID=A0A2N5VKC2_9BASI|nr:hypothetical protein PCASD_01442 [Puccinia coronata f. sp. avenae]